MYGAVDKVSRTGDTMSGPLTSSSSVTTGVPVLTYASVISLDASTGGHFRVTLTGNAEMGTPANPADGQKITFEVVQDSAGHRTLTWSSAYNFGQAGQPTLTTTAGKRDLIGFVYSASEGQWLFAGIMAGF
jgi:hypothetical protein